MLSRTMKQALFASSIDQGGGKRRAAGMELMISMVKWLCFNERGIYAFAQHH